MLKFVKKINSPFIVDICLSELLVCRNDCKVGSPLNRVVGIFLEPPPITYLDIKQIIPSDP